MKITPAFGENDRAALVFVQALLEYAAAIAVALVLSREIVEWLTAMDRATAHTLSPLSETAKGLALLGSHQRRLAAQLDVSGLGLRAPLVGP